VCELIGLFALNTLANKFAKELKIELYQDDGLAVVKSTSGSYSKIRHEKTSVRSHIPLRLV
jgi:hypothetical protein